jgi:hypothetical protein
VSRLTRNLLALAAGALLGAAAVFGTFVFVLKSVYPHA